MRASGTALLDGQLVSGITVEWEDGVTCVRPHAAGDPPCEGLLLPGLVNAHLHLELSWMAGQIPAGLGFDGWLSGLLGLTRPPDATVDDGLRQLVQAGTSAVSDICNGALPAGIQDTAVMGPRAMAAALDQVGIRGIVQSELFGLDVRRQEALLKAVGSLEAMGGVTVRPTPHALYSTRWPVIEAALAVSGPPASIHVSEEPGELEFLMEGTGRFADRLDRLGLQWRDWRPPGPPIAALEARGLLHDLLLVHGVCFTDDERARVARSGCAVVVCARSNLHIGGQLPDVPALFASGIPVALGTDSLASCADLDVLKEVPVLHEAFPDVPVERWLHAATAGGADALGLDLGRLKPGEPKLLRAHPERPWEGREVLCG